MSTSSDNNRLILKSGDNEIFEVEEIVASESVLIKQRMEDVSIDGYISLPNVTGNILSKVLEYCKKHVDASKSADPTAVAELKVFDAEFIDVEPSTLFDLVMTANYLNIKGLRDLTCQTVTNRIEENTTEEIRNKFNMKNDLTREEEDEVMRENQ